MVATLSARDSEAPVELGSASCETRRGFLSEGNRSHASSPALISASCVESVSFGRGVECVVVVGPRVERCRQGGPTGQAPQDLGAAGVIVRESPTSLGQNRSQLNALKRKLTILVVTVGFLSLSLSNCLSRPNGVTNRTASVYTLVTSVDLRTVSTAS